MMNMNSGYSGWSMSKNAVLAYAYGEKPKSKWTKKAMLEAILDYMREFEIDAEDRFESIARMRKADIFDRFFAWSSWHHTSKYANETDFYWIDEEELVGYLEND